MMTDQNPATERSAADDVQESLVAEKYAHKLIRKLRIRLDDQPGKLAEVATAIGAEGGLIGDVESLAINSQSILRNVTVYVDDAAHLDRLLQRVTALDGIAVERVVDDVLAVHEGGKLRVSAKAAIDNLRDLQMIYTPGVASVCKTVAQDEAAYRRYTWVSNTVAIVTDGSAVLGLGDIGPKAALPVMEGKAVILDRLAGVGCVPILLSAGMSNDEIVRTVEAISTGFGVIMLEDIAAPKCFEIESLLSQRLSIPVFHDDQHGTAVIVLAALLNACRKFNAELGPLRIVIAGSGAAGSATARLLLAAGARDVICCDRSGALYKGRTEHMNPAKDALAAETNPHGIKGTLAEVMTGSHVFVGLSSAGLVSRAMVASMADPRFVLALANPTPEIPPKDATAAGAKVALDGRTVNNALVFPGLIRGALDSGAKRITEGMKLAAARAIADLTPEGLLLPSILNRGVHKAVAEAVHKAWYGQA
ncbi:MAG: NAD-dependent malic enzyme [Sedimentisphaerales bacterium]|nr:NAD-dependent malic enzyme [Sedimentisphaerales bacterium]